LSETGTKSSLEGGAPFAIRDTDGAILVPAETVARELGLSTEALLQNLRAGVVYQTTERGVDDDAGKLGVTFRYRNRQFQAVVDDGGHLVHSGRL